MNCTSCQFENPDGFKFCGSCGKSLEAVTRLEAERRQITVMFCDLVGSTDLSAAIDAEELRELVRAYQAICAEVFEKNHGHVAQYLGDGILAYFGYPVAYEDSTSKAVESALEIHQRIEQWNKTVPQNIQLRTGIHTGMVVIGEVGAGAHRENLALGETPNLAARLQGEAAPGEVVISEDTEALVADRFELESLGPRTLKGLPEPIEVFLVKQATDPRARRSLARAKRSRVPLLGYDTERAVLSEVWQSACSGLGGALSLIGEAGIGKTRLVQWLKERVFQEQNYVVSLYPTSETSNSPLSSLMEQLSYEVPEASAIEEKCPGFEAVELLEELLGFREAAPVPGRQKLRINTLIDFWIRMSQSRPLLLVVDNAEYLDPSTNELLDMFRGRISEHRALLITTWRNTPQESWGRALLLKGLEVDDLNTLVKLSAEEPLSRSECLQIARRAEGNPFFAEELARNPEADHASKLQDLLMARLDRFGVAKPVVQRLSTAGRRFPEPILQAISQCVSDPVQQVAERCLKERVLQRDSNEIAFSQGLFHRTCYESLLRKSQQEFHGELATAILQFLPDWQEQAPEVPAFHFLRSGTPEKAIPFLAQAGRKALRMSAEREAAHHFETALGILPDGPEWIEQRLGLLLSLGTALIATRGYAHPSVREVFSEAREICAGLGDPPPVFPALCGLWAFAFVSGALDEALTLAQRLQELAALDLTDGPRRLVSHAACGQTHFMRGEFPEAREHMEAVCALHQPEFHGSEAFSYFQTDPYIATNSYFAMLEHLEGQDGACRERSEVALKSAEELQMAHTLAHTLFYDAWMAYELQEFERFGDRLGRLAENAQKYDFPLWLILAGVLEALIKQDAGTYLELLGHLEQTGTKLGETWFVGNVYRLLAGAGQTEPAKAALEQCRAIAAERGERFYIGKLV